MNQEDKPAFAIILIGLPGTGKSFLSKKLQQFLNFYSIKTKAFNVGEYRREILGNVPSDFFDPLNQDYFEKRWEIAQQALEDMIKFLKTEGRVGILDTTITTLSEYRSKIAEKIEENNLKLVFLEVICEDESIIERNIREVKILSQDYIGYDVDDVIQDFKKRIENHLPHYDRIDIENETRSFVQVLNNGKLSSNIGEHVILNKIKGYMETKIVYFLMNIQTTPKKIYLLRPGQNISTMKEDTTLSSEGESYAKSLTSKLISISDHEERSKNVTVFCAPRAYSLETVRYFPETYKIIEKAELIEMHPGEYAAMDMDAIAKNYPEQYADYEKDRFRYRFPRAEVLFLYVVLS
eukprot:NODE_95_length_21511_cov_0.501168.p7 type:complete len:351 gc:universal NODE_95_length_21511_cov_0.501168:3343-2291(-)